MGEEDLEQMEGDVQDSLEDIQYDKVTHRGGWSVPGTDKWVLDSLNGYRQCCGSVTFWCGSGSVPVPIESGSCYFQDTFSLIFQR
jgi:hypothetical protein